MRLQIIGGLMLAAGLATGSAYAQSGSAGQQGQPSGSTAQQGQSGSQAKSDQQARASKQSADQQATNKATMHVATVNAGLQSATLASAMLKELSQNPQTIDRTHAQTLVTNIREDLRLANTHLTELKSIKTSTEDPKRQQDIQELTQKVQRAQQIVTKMPEQYTKPQQLNQSATQIHDQLKDSAEGLKSVAKSMNVKINLNPTG